MTNFTNVTYLTGFTGDDSYLLVTAKEAIIVSDPRYTTQLEEECDDVKHHIRPPGKSMLDGVAGVVRAAKVSKLAVEADSMSVGLFRQLEAKLNKVALHEASGLVEELRMVKDKEVGVVVAIAQHPKADRRLLLALAADPRSLEIRESAKIRLQPLLRSEIREDILERWEEP